MLWGPSAREESRPLPFRRRPGAWAKGDAPSPGPQGELERVPGTQV